MISLVGAECQGRYHDSRRYLGRASRAERCKHAFGLHCAMTWDPRCSHKRTKERGERGEERASPREQITRPGIDASRFSVNPPKILSKLQSQPSSHLLLHQPSASLPVRDYSNSDIFRAINGPRPGNAHTPALACSSSTTPRRWPARHHRPSPWRASRLRLSPTFSALSEGRTSTQAVAQGCGMHMCVCCCPSLPPSTA